MRVLIIGAVALAAGISAVPANAIAVINASFETQFIGQSFGFCGTNCTYSTDPIVGWTSAGAGASGQFLSGPPVNTTYFNYIPNGITTGFSQGGSLSQTVAPTAYAGGTYTLKVDVGYRKDYTPLGIVELDFGANQIFATGVAPTAGNWSTYTAVYTATLADAGAPITIKLSAAGIEGDFDNVRLRAINVPEPGTWALFIAGFGLIGLAQRRKRPLSV